MGHKAQPGLIGDHADRLVLVLQAVAELRRSYAQVRSVADLGRCDHAARQLRSLLHDREVRARLDAELRRRPPLERALTRAVVNADLVEREAALGPSFGYGEREVRKYVKLARDAAMPDEVTDTDELIHHVDAIHARARELVAGAGSRLSRWRARRQARTLVDDGLFAIAVLVANAGHRALFDLSYALGAVGMVPA